MKEDIHNYLKLGINHHMCFPESIKNFDIHLITLSKLLQRSDFEVIDLFVPYDKKIRKKEQQLILTNNKEIIYNAHFLPSSPVWSCSPDAVIRAQALILAYEQIDLAYSLGAKMILFGSGVDPGEKYRQQTKKWFTEYCIEFCNYLAEKGDMIAVIEPFDRNRAKFFFAGPTAEVVEIIEHVRCNFKNLYLQLDMAHISIMGETFKHALNTGIHLLRHVHLGNCVIRNPNSKFYGDQHPPFGIEDGESDVEELSEFLKVALEVGFLNKKDRPSVTIETKPYPNYSPEESIEITKEKIIQAWRMI